VEEEFLELVSFLVNIEKHTQRTFKNTVIKFDEIFLRLLEMSDPVDDPLPPQLQKTSLVLFRKIVERENLNLTSPAADWEFPDYEKFFAKIVSA
jgi:hypothetical protein